MMRFFFREDGISIDSPMAKSLIGKSQDDEAVVKTPKGEVYWRIIKIIYNKEPSK